MFKIASHERQNGHVPDAGAQTPRTISAIIGALPTRVATPVEELAQLRFEEKRVEEKIRETQEMLSAVRRSTSAALAHSFATVTDNVVLIEEDLMETERSYERLLQSLLEMKNAFEQQMRALDEQIVQANVEHLRETFHQKEGALDECLSGIDQKILDCLVYIEQYKSTHADLVALKSRLHQLNSDSLDVPEPVPTHDVEGVIYRRIEHLRSQGKF
ncbi:MAG: hypothetical protein ACREQK_14455 [Candidatus Binatia bacterium]